MLESNQEKSLYKAFYFYLLPFFCILNADIVEYVFCIVSDIENFNLEPIIEKKKVDPYFPIVSAKKLDRIWLTIREELGTFWRDLGRHLRIRECVIQDIDKPNRSLQLKAKLLLEYYEQRADPQKWFLILCEALEKSRRKDLSRKIQDIMIMNM